MYVYGLVVRPVNTTIPAEAVKWSFFTPQGDAQFSVSAEVLQKGGGVLAEIMVPFGLPVGSEGFSQGTLPRQGSWLCWAGHMLQERLCSMVACRNIYFGVFAQEPRALFSFEYG